MKFSGAQLLQSLFFLALGATLVYFQIHSLSDEGRKQVAYALSHANVFWVVLAMFTTILSNIIRAVRWSLLIKATNESIKINHSFYAVMIGYLVNSFIPRGGELARCGVITRTDNIRFEKLVGTVIAERIFDLIVLILIVLLTVVIQFRFISKFLNDKLFQPFISRFNFSFDSLLLVTTILICAVGAFLILNKYVFQPSKISQSLNQRWLRVKDNFTQGLSSILTLKNKSLFIFYSISMWICYFFISIFIFKSLPESAHLGLDAGLSVLTSGSLGLVVPTPGGLGSYHQFVSNTLQLYEISPAIGVSLSWLIWIANYVVILVLGVLSFILVSLKQ